MNKGDFVTVVMAHNNCFGLGLHCRFKATILHIPGDPGDMWYVHVILTDAKEKTRTAVIAINPMSLYFIGIASLSIGR